MAKTEAEIKTIKENIQKCKIALEKEINDLKVILPKIGGKADDTKPLTEGFKKVYDTIFDHLLKELNATSAQNNKQKVDNLKK